MARLTEEGRELRLRLCAHLRRLYAEHRFTTRDAMASKMGMNPGHFSSLFNLKTEIGLDGAVLMHRVFGESLNALCDTDPPAEFYPPGTRPGMFFSNRADVPLAAETSPRYGASPSPAKPEKQAQRRAGGRRR